jgi:pyrimidine-nucleoside phosphorylase
MVPQWMIEKKRDGHALSTEDIQAFIAGYTAGHIPDYQMAALAMAIYFRGMTFEETAALTDAMMRSGEMVDASRIRKPKVDKHSTGGIGDKVSLILAPLAASCGLAVPMISGRGLGITGGTLDKLESISGYRTRLSITEFLDIIESCGCSMIGQTPELAPADRKLYALRDVTGTVPSIPLISASIMSKKLAEGADSLVLDVKWGRGAFMKDTKSAMELARTMVEIGRRMGRGMTAMVTDMNQPLGRTAGNAIEVREAIETLRGQGPEDLTVLTLELTAHMLILGGKATTVKDAIPLLRRNLENGTAFDVFRRMVQLHGGDIRILDDPSLLPSATVRETLTAATAGYVADVDADAVGRAVLVLGAGRTRVDDPVDPAAGIGDMVKSGEEVAKGDRLMTLYASGHSRIAEAQALLAQAVRISDTPATPRPLVAETLTLEAMPTTELRP